MTIFHFDNRLFQRGQTWEECIESWEYKRDTFLHNVREGRTLKSTAKLLLKLPNHTRIAVYYSNAMLDSLKALPMLGNTFAQDPHIVTRYFCGEHFFPILYEVLGRKMPQVLFLTRSGASRPVWGPRPETVTAQLSHQEDGMKSDDWLQSYDMDRFQKELDQSLAKRLFRSSQGYNFVVNGRY